MRARVVEGYNPDFDIDLRIGQKAELLTEQFLRGVMDTVEVKSDLVWANTNRVYLEHECRRKDGWQPSGIASTKADYWALVLGETIILLIPTWALQAAHRKALDPALRLTREEKDGSHPTRGVAIPTQLLLQWLFTAIRERRAEMELTAA